MVQYHKEEGKIVKKIKYIKSALVIVFCAITLTTSSICVDRVIAEPVVTTPVVQTTGTVSPLLIVKNPTSFLNKTVKMNAKFDKFSTLGLDYKPALRESKDYISFLIKRDDTVHDIPLSEMKLFLKRDMAEKFIDLKTDDEISITGTVFSDALGDPWIEVSSLVLTKKAPTKDGV